MINLYKNELRECREILAKNAENMAARESLKIIYQAYFDSNLIFFEREYLQEENVMYLQKYYFLFGLVDKISKIKTFNNKAKVATTLSKNDILELANEFYKYGTNKELYDLFLKLYKNIDIHKSIFNRFRAFSKFWPHQNQYDSKIYCGLSYSDLFFVFVVVHEIGHGIQYLNNFYSSLYLENYIFAEIVSTFLEMVSGNYFYNSRFQKDALIYSLNDFDGIINKAKILGNYDTSLIYKKNPIDDYPYIVAYNIAIELYMIYLEDLDKAFYYLQKIIEIPLYLPPEEYYQRILNLGITPGKNLDKYRLHLTRKLENGNLKR